MSEAYKFLPPDRKAQHEACTHMFQYLSDKFKDPNDSLESLITTLTFMIVSGTPDEIEYEQAFIKLINRLYNYKTMGLTFMKMKNLMGLTNMSEALADIVTELHKRKQS